SPQLIPEIKCRSHKTEISPLAALMPPLKITGKVKLKRLGKYKSRALLFVNFSTCGKIRAHRPSPWNECFQFAAKRLSDLPGLDVLTILPLNRLHLIFEPELELF